MKKYNVNTSTCYRLIDSKIACGQAYIFLLPDGDNSIIVIPSANASWPNQLNKIQIESIKNSDCILLQREVPEIYNIRIAKIAKQYGITVILDVGGEDSKISTELLNLIDILSPNQTELDRLISYYDDEKTSINKQYSATITNSKYSKMKKIRRACTILQSINKNLSILLKRGENGATYIDNKGNIIQENALKLNSNQINDTTGAGDCFTGAFAVEYIRQQKINDIWKKKDVDQTITNQCIANAMKFGCIAAGLSIQKKGTIASIPNLRDVVCYTLSQQI